MNSEGLTVFGYSLPKFLNFKRQATLCDCQSPAISRLGFFNLFRQIQVRFWLGLRRVFPGPSRAQPGAGVAAPGALGAELGAELGEGGPPPRGVGHLQTFGTKNKKPKSGGQAEVGFSGWMDGAQTRRELRGRDFQVEPFLFLVVPFFFWGGV